MWKTLIRQCIYTSPSEIKVYQNFVYRWLTYKNDVFVQTIINRRNPAKPCLDYLIPLTLPMIMKPEEILLLGLGGGAIVHILKEYSYDKTIVAIDNNLEIIEVAKKYFFLSKMRNLIIIHDEAKNFVQNITKKYKYIIIDLFTDSTFPVECADIDFFKSCRKLLAEDGIIAVNTATLSDNWSIFNKIKTVFDNNTVVFPINNSVNTVILASKCLSNTALLAQVTKNKPYKHCFWDKRWGMTARI